MDSNRFRVALVREVTPGITPGSARFRTARVTAETLAYAATFFQSAELRADRMNQAPAKQNENVGGGLPGEFSFPYDETALSEILRSAFYNPWQRTPQHFNDGTADSVITDFNATTGTFTVVDQSGAGGFAGSAYKAGHLIQVSGFTAANNNAIRRVSSSSGTTVVVGAAGTNDTAPGAQARIKVVGFRGASGDVTAAAGGLASTALDFTTLGLVPGMWLKVGGSAAGEQFATAGCNGWARISGVITATSIPLDNLPAGWGVDSGSGKTISVWFGDYVRNGVTANTMSIEKAALSQASPTRIIHRGQTTDKYTVTMVTDQAITWQAEFVGMNGAQQTTDYGASYDAATTEPVLTSNVSVADVREGGSALGSPNWSRQLQIVINNSARRINALGNTGAVALGVGDSMITGGLDTYFGSNALYQKFLAGTPTSIAARSQTTKTAGTSGRAIIWGVPAATYISGNPNAGGKSQDVVLPLQFQGSIDTLTNCQIQLDRLEYFEM